MKILLIAVAVIVGLVVLGLFLAARLFASQLAAAGAAAAAAAASASAPTQLARVPSPAIVEAALQPHREALEASRRPVVRVDLAEFPADDLLASKVGGRAWWPQDQPAPVGEDGAPLILLAQLNFGEMPPSSQYPDSGLLQFFIAGDDHYGANFEGDFSEASLSQQRNFRVVYWRDTAGPSQALSVVSDPDAMTPHVSAQPRWMHFTADTERMSSSDYRFERLVGGNAYDTFEAWAKANGHDEAVVDDIFRSLDGSGHKIGGYPYFSQSDPRDGGPMELLLQFDSDDRMMWGDSGVGGFFIDPAALARGDFSRVMYHWDCH